MLSFIREELGGIEAMGYQVDLVWFCKLHERVVVDTSMRYGDNTYVTGYPWPPAHTTNYTSRTETSPTLRLGESTRPELTILESKQRNFGLLKVFDLLPQSDGTRVGMPWMILLQRALSFPQLGFNR